MKNRDSLGWLFIAPFLIVFLTFSIYPVLRTLYLSFTDYSGFNVPTWTGLTNYKRVFKDKLLWEAFGNTLKIWGINIVLQLGIAFLLTIVFSDIKYRMKGLSVFRAIFYLPVSGGEDLHDIAKFRRPVNDSLAQASLEFAEYV